MKIEEIKQTFEEIGELRKLARDKEIQLVRQLEQDGVLSAAEAILLGSGLPGWGISGSGQAMEAIVIAALDRKKEAEDAGSSVKVE